MRTPVGDRVRLLLVLGRFVRSESRIADTGDGETLHRRDGVLQHDRFFWRATARAVICESWLSADIDVGNAELADRVDKTTNSICVPQSLMSPVSITKSM